MALPFGDEIKDYLRVTTDVEDDLFDLLSDSAQAWLRAHYKVPLSAQARTFVGLWPRIGVQREEDTRLVLPIKPCAATGTVLDADGDTVSSATYLIDQRTGYIEARRGESFGNPPYDVTITVGWDQHPQYASEVEPILRQAILWAASTYYRNRNVAAIYEQSGGQVSITYTEQDIPPLLRSLMRGLEDTAWFA